MNRFNHQDFFDVDLPKIESDIANDKQFEEFLACLDKAIIEITKNPTNEEVPLKRPPLAPTYRKKKFHSLLKPPKGMKADMRLVFRCNLSKNTLYIFGVGKRRP